MQEHTECLNVEGEELLMLDKVIDFETVWSSSTLSLSTLSAGDDEVGHDVRGVGVVLGLKLDLDMLDGGREWLAVLSTTNYFPSTPLLYTIRRLLVR